MTSASVPASRVPAQVPALPSLRDTLYAVRYDKPFPTQDDLDYGIYHSNRIETLRCKVRQCSLSTRDGQDECSDAR